MNWACRECGTHLLVGVSPCSNCQGEDIATDPKEVEEIMGKAHRDRPPTRFNENPQSYDAFSLEPVGEQSHDPVTEPPVLPEAPGQNPDGELLALEVDYSSWTVPQLQSELRKRQDAYAEAEDEEGLEAVSFTKDDKKADLITKLTEDDEAQVDEGAED